MFAEYVHRSLGATKMTAASCGMFSSWASIVISWRAQGILREQVAPRLLILDARVRNQEGIERLTGILLCLVEGLLYLLLPGIAEYVGLVVDRVGALGRRGRRRDHHRCQKKQHREQ